MFNLKTYMPPFWEHRVDVDNEIWFGGEILFALGVEVNITSKEYSKFSIELEN